MGRVSSFKTAGGSSSFAGAGKASSFAKAGQASSVNTAERVDISDVYTFKFKGSEPMCLAAAICFPKKCLWILFLGQTSQLAEFLSGDLDKAVLPITVDPAENLNAWLIQQEVSVYLKRVITMWGFSALRPDQLTTLLDLSLALLEHELTVSPVQHRCKTLGDMIRLRMDMFSLNPAGVARILETDLTLIEQIIAGESKPDLTLAVGLYKELRIPAQFILDHV